MDDTPSSKAGVLVVLRLVLAKKLVAEVQMVLMRKKIQDGCLSSLKSK